MCSEAGCNTASEPWRARPRHSAAALSDGSRELAGGAASGAMAENAAGVSALDRSPMRLRARVVAILAVSIACTGSHADTGGPPQPRARPAAPVVLAPGKVTPVS